MLDRAQLRFSSSSTAGTRSVPIGGHYCCSRNGWRILLDANTYYYLMIGRPLARSPYIVCFAILAYGPLHRHQRDRAGAAGVPGGVISVLYKKCDPKQRTRQLSTRPSRCCARTTAYIPHAPSPARPHVVASIAARCQPPLDGPLLPAAHPEAPACGKQTTSEPRRPAYCAATERCKRMHIGGGRG
jgi:hypothetical protein